MNNCEESYANEGSGASWQICLLLPTLNRKNETRNGYFIRIRHLSPFAPALANFGAGGILQGGECRRRDRRAPQVVPRTRPGSVW